jgi:3'-phosphoadenosine 5'-phosphosulfate sulfotransferase (PAPS reductase)/FAD synthetase
MLDLPPVKYVFFDTGLEMDATKRHVEEVQKLYGIEIETVKPKKNIVTSCREYGIPFVSKLMSEGLSRLQRKNIPISIYDEYQNAEDKVAKRRELSERYPNSESAINFLCCCKTDGEPKKVSELVMDSSKYMVAFLKENPVPFKVSSKCCTYCKKSPAHEAQKNYDMVITGERRAEGGARAIPNKGGRGEVGCFTETADGKFRLRPLFYVTDTDKAWYKEYYGLRYSDAYEVYGLKRTGCCGCAIPAKAADDLEKIRPFEPKLVKAAWAVFGESYLFRDKYNEYKAERKRQEREAKND